jgi:hypothetical protein
MARSLLARTAVVALTACSALTAGVVAAGAAAADPAPGLHAKVPGTGLVNNPHLTDSLGRKLK